MRKISHILIRTCEISIITMIPVMTVVVFVQVVLRYVFLSPLVWAEESARYLLIWISCLGSAYGVKKGIHISVMFVYKKLRGRLKGTIALASYILQMGFFGVCFVKGLVLAVGEWNQISPGMGVRMTWVLGSIPVGFLFMLFFCAEDLMNTMKKTGDWKEDF